MFGSKMKKTILRYLPFFSFYLHQGMITALIFQGIVGYFRNEGMNLAQLSWLYIAMMPWIGKFLWSPWFERNSLTLFKNRYLGSLVLIQVTIILFFVIGSFIEKTTPIWIVISFSTLLMLLSSLHGIYANGILLFSFKKDEHSYATVTQIGGSYSGIILGVFAFLTITQYTNWQIGFLFMAGVSSLLLLSIFFLNTIEEIPSGSRKPSFNLSCIKEVWSGILLSAIYYIANRGIMSLETVFLIDQGLDISKVGTILTINNTIFSGIGILLGGFILRKLNNIQCIITVMLMNFIIAIIFVAGQSQFSLTNWILLYAIFSIFASIGFVTLYSILMSMVRAHQPASDYALFQSIDMSVAMIMSFIAVRLAQYGYDVSYSLMAGISLFSIITIVLLHEKLFKNTNTLKLDEEMEIL